MLLRLTASRGAVFSLRSAMFTVNVDVFCASMKNAINARNMSGNANSPEASSHELVKAIEAKWKGQKLREALPKFK
jgi:hypothetical protein